MKNGDLVVFDFDGVVCDSARETAASAWRAGRRLWPEWRDEEPAPHHVERFCRLRPFLETGYQSIGLMRMACATDHRPEDLTVAEVEAWIDQLYGEMGVGRREMVDLFGSTRDQWIKTDPAGWLARHRFYPGIVALLARLTAASRPVAILSTKQERFIHELLKGAGIVLPAEQVFGLERDKPKTASLREFRKESAPGQAIHFVEDRLPTLQAVAALPELAAIKLYLADWGYNTAEDRRQAGLDRRLTTLALADLATFPLGGPPRKGFCGHGIVSPYRAGPGNVCR